MRSCWLALLALVTWSMSAFAQDIRTVAPKQPLPRQNAGMIKPPQSLSMPVNASKSPLLAKLTGLRFVNSDQKIVRSGTRGAGIQTVFLPLMNSPRVKRRLSAFLGKPLFAEDLTKISNIVISWYRANNYPMVDVVFPEQDITTGIVQAIVIEYRLGKVNVKGNKYFSSRLLRSQIETKRGEAINFSRLKTDLNKLNRSPFRTVNAVFGKSDVVGATDLTLETQDRFPFSAYVGIDNLGLPITARDRYSIGFSVGDPFGFDQQFSYAFITSPDLWRTRNNGAGLSNKPRFTAHSGAYLLPLGNGDAININGFYVSQVPNLGPDFGQVGHGLQFSFRYEMPLAIRGALSQQLQFGFDYKRFDNNLAFGGTQIFSSKYKIAQLVVSYDATLVDRYGQTTVENQLVISPGNLLPGNNSATFIASGVAQSNARYLYDNIEVMRVTSLPWDASIVLRGKAQMATHELLPSEQLGAGGSDSVRGYDPRVANGSQGIVTSVELRSPIMTPLLDTLGVRDQGQLLAFWDYGKVSYLYPQTNLPKSAKLQSAGFGMRYTIGRNVDLRMDYGWQLEKAPGATKLGHLANIAVTLAY